MLIVMRIKGKAFKHCPNTEILEFNQTYKEVPISIEVLLQIKYWKNWIELTLYVLYL